ncbi:50S ribosomal protein L19 [Candidatus Uhrbacteria bacterium]|nr:50S ribosomal protein L19 [Candidatus Uhrbacteria bacterium]
MSDQQSPTPEEKVEDTTPSQTQASEDQSSTGSDASESTVIEKPEPAYKAKLVNIDELHAGQTVRLHERIKDVSPKGEERERVQVFEGIILGVKGAGISRTLTIRKVSDGVGVEKIYPINSPVIAKIELVKTAKVRRAKLGYLIDIKNRFKRKLKEVYVK